MACFQNWPILCLWGSININTPFPPMSSFALINYHVSVRKLTLFPVNTNDHSIPVRNIENNCLPQSHSTLSNSEQMVLNFM